VFKNHKSSEIFTLPKNHEKPSVFESHEIFTLPRNHEKPSKSIKNHQIFTLPKNHEKPSKCLKIMKAMRFSHCPEIMKNHQKV
jgi:hypothetical protein